MNKKSFLKAGLEAATGIALVAVAMSSIACTPAGMTVQDDGGAITIRTSSGKPILTYNYAVTPAPEGVSHLYDRSGYIHPAYTPSGKVITNIQPEDHRHHYGIWNPWTRVEYDGRTYDLWNLGDSLGTVRAKEVVKTYQSRDEAGFDATLEHIAFTPGSETVIMNELWEVRAVETADGYLWDFTSTLTPATDKAVTIKAYRYQGFSIRATPDWKYEDTEMMSSEGLDRAQIDASTGRWLYTNGNGPAGASGILFLSHPGNYNTPEPMRIWTTGDVYMNFCPAKTKDWILEPGKSYQLKYRVLTYDGAINPEKAEALWQDF